MKRDSKPGPDGSGSKLKTTKKSQSKIENFGKLDYEGGRVRPEKLTSYFCQAIKLLARNHPSDQVRQTHKNSYAGSHEFIWHLTKLNTSGDLTSCSIITGR